MLETSFSSFISKKLGEFPVFRIFMAKNSCFGLYFTVNQQFGPNRQLRRHCDVIHGIFVLFWYVWKEETHTYTMVPKKYTSGVFFLKVNRGLRQPPLVRRVTKNSLVRRGLTFLIESVSFYFHFFLLIKRFCFQTYCIFYLDALYVFAINIL